MCDWTDGVRPSGQGMVKGEMKLKIFISSVQKEFAEERRLLKRYISKNPAYRRKTVKGEGEGMRG